MLKKLWFFGQGVMTKNEIILFLSVKKLLTDFEKELVVASEVLFSTGTAAGGLVRGVLFDLSWSI